MKAIANENSGWRLTVGLAAAATAAFALMALFALGIGDRAGAASATASGSRTVTIDHFKYLPSSLRVPKGTRVVFSNASRVAHTATLKGSFDTGKIRPGSAVAVTFTAKGTYAYRCTLHPEMRGKITVG